MIYADPDSSSLELVREVLPKFGDFTVFPAPSLSDAMDLLVTQRMDCVVFADAFPASARDEFVDALSSQGDFTRSASADRPSATPSLNTAAPGESSAEPPGDGFRELLSWIEILAGKRCSGFALDSRSYSTSEVRDRVGQFEDLRELPPTDTPDRRERDQNADLLVELHEATSGLLHAQTVEEILAVVLAAADNILELPAVGIYTWDEQAGALRPHTSTEETRALLGDLPTFTGPSSLAWNAFVDGEFRVHENVARHPDRYNSETPIETELFAPLGEHGILISGATEPGSFDDIERRATKMLAANTVTALDLADQKRQLEHHREQLQDQHDQLTTLKRINRVNRAIGQATVTASTRSDIEQTICDRLAAIDPYSFAWIGQRERGDELRMRQWSGANGEFLDRVYGGDGTSSEQRPPAARALDTGTVQVVQDVFSDDLVDPWRKTALNHGFQSVISLPLSHQQTTQGVLEVYALQPNAFDEEEREAFVELSEMVANAFNAVERRQALLSDARTELELQMSDQNDLFSRTARAVGAELEVNKIVSHDDGSWLLYLATDDADTSGVLSAVRQSAVVESAERTWSRDGTTLFGVTLAEFELGELLSNRGATPEAIKATPDQTMLQLSVPESADVRSVVSTCQSKYADAELVRRTSGVSTEDIESDVQLLESLSDKQLEALEVALQDGFFEWPRDKTGEEIADSLGVTPPTFHRHTRMGLAALLQELLET